MIADFDIKDRHTWAWIDDGRVSASWVRDGSTFVLNPVDRHSYYQQTSEGYMVLHYCSMENADTRQVFNPLICACDWSQNVTEEQIYDWAVSKGLVVDQRTKR
jgi:hypothetical protein